MAEYPDIDAINEGDIGERDRVLTQVESEATIAAKPSLDLRRVVDQLRAWLSAQYPDPMSGWEITMKLEDRSPWLLITARPSMPYETGTVPPELEFAAWLASGILHRMIGGLVQEPPLEVPA